MTFIGSVFIDPDTCTRAILNCFCGLYTNQTHTFAPPTVLRKVVERVLVGSLYLPWGLRNKGEVGEIQEGVGGE